MERFVRRHNVERYRALLAEETNPVKRAMLERLLREEEQRQLNAHDFEQKEVRQPSGARPEK